MRPWILMILDQNWYSLNKIRAKSRLSVSACYLYSNYSFSDQTIKKCIRLTIYINIFWALFLFFVLKWKKYQNHNVVCYIKTMTSYHFEFPTVCLKLLQQNTMCVVGVKLNTSNSKCMYQLELSEDNVIAYVSHRL